MERLKTMPPWDQRVRELVQSWPDYHRRQIAEAGARAVDQAILDAFTYLRPQLHPPRPQRVADMVAQQVLDLYDPTGLEEGDEIG